MSLFVFAFLYMVCYCQEMPTEKYPILFVPGGNSIKKNEAFRYENRNPSRSPAIRIFIEFGIKSKPKIPKKKK
jgi:hypothetical protein